MIKKVIKLTESDLVKIVKRVIEEQITDKGQIVPKTIKIPDNNPKGFPFKAGTEVKTDDFISILKKSPVGVNAFHIKSDGWEFPIYPVYGNIGNFRVSFEPFDKVNGKYMLRWTKSF
jgi:hypothetical protein